MYMGCIWMGQAGIEGTVDYVSQHPKYCSQWCLWYICLLSTPQPLRTHDCTSVLSTRSLTVQILLTSPSSS